MFLSSVLNININYKQMRKQACHKHTCTYVYVYRNPYIYRKKVIKGGEVGTKESVSEMYARNEEYECRRILGLSINK